MLDRLWATWRFKYVTRGAEAASKDLPESEINDQQATLFERVLRLDDQDGLIVAREALVSVILNKFPYGSGHCLVIPNRGVERLAELTPQESTALWAAVNKCAVVVEAEYGCQGINIGLNQGRAAGAGVPEHLHVHVLPRWEADTSFVTTTAELRVLPEDLEVSWQRMRDAWNSAV